MSHKYEKLKDLLKELFQLDQPDLDFGLYRIMHAKSAEITQFLDKDLLPQVNQAFGLYKTSDKAELEKELARAIDQAHSLGADPETLPKVRELRDKIANESVDLSALESEVYDHLYTFFRRYYSEGDFLAKRVYKPGVYSIPYEGEEVTLYWANRDQYYIKTSEYLRDYAFRLRPADNQNPMRVHFRLVDAAEGEHGNVKAAEGKDRVFILASAGESGRDFISEAIGEGGKELSISFEYRPATRADWPDGIAETKKGPPAQKDLISVAAEKILASADGTLASWISELSKPHVNASGHQAEYSRLLAHLRRYTARNTFDYFIHKDLGEFLARELDFYIKNEVMHLDDIESEAVSRVEQYLSKIKVIRIVAGKITTFLAQLENFEKKLWLKKKFVIETSYCITLGCVPDDFYSEIAKNDAQRDEWVRLFEINEIKENLTVIGYSEPLTLAFLKANPSLVVDTRNFSIDFTARIIEALGDLEHLIDGIVLHSENFQALSLIQSRFRRSVQCVYIDPPYNTDASPIIYKNGYRHSTWATMLHNRLDLDFPLRMVPSIRCIAIDDFEYPNLQGVIESLSSDVHHATVSVRSKPQGRPTASGFSANHEYAVFWGDPDASIGRLPRSGSKADRYPHSDESGIYSWANFRKSGTDSDRSDRRKSFYPVFVRNSQVRIPELTWNVAEENWQLLEEPEEGEVAVWPIDSENTEKVWTCSPSRARSELDDIRIERSAEGKIEIYKKYRPNQDGALPGTWWDDSSYSASESGTKVLKDLFGAGDFDYPKSVHLVEDCLRVCGLVGQGTVLDYFAGSGTTGHASINLNREDGGRRRFILIEMGPYFDTVLLPRIKKVTFTPEWAAGKPKRQATTDESKRGPRIVKVVRLETYEDALNNLDTHRTPMQQSLLDAEVTEGANGFKEQFFLRYMLDVESRGSQTLLNVPAFEDPTAYKLKVKQLGSDESCEVNVDLLETFNWLVGLTVMLIAAPQRFTGEFERDSEKRLRVKGRIKQEADGPWWFRTVIGTTPDGRSTLIIWRKLTGKLEQDNLMLDEWFTKQGYSTKDYEFQLIYVNGDCNLENLKAPDDTWKVRLIEEDFHRLMFDTEGV